MKINLILTSLKNLTCFVIKRNQIFINFKIQSNNIKNK